jgi:hypothetical protein
MHPVSELTELIDAYAGAVGLQRGPQAAMEGERGDQGTLWEAPYAQLMLWRIRSTDRGEIRAEVDKAQEVLDGLLLSAEKRLSGVVDGYLLLSLGYEPDMELLSLIRNIELDTTACRKIFVWPVAGDSPESRWQRLWRTTVIALPESPSPGRMLELPELKEPVREIWREISRSGSGNAARKLLKESRKW